MNVAGDSQAARRWRAPADDGGTLIDPPLSQVEALLSANAAALQAAGCDLQGRSLRELSRQARGELLIAARRYTAAYRDPPSFASTDLVLLAGHQPQLFHCGVWAKNFALGYLARRHQATAINLVIDNDTLKVPTVRIPGGVVSQPTAREIEFDATCPETPFEDRAIADRDLFESFGRRAADELAPLAPDPILNEYWPLAVARAREGARLGACLSQARHQLEATFGLATLEVPQGWLCELPAFCWFAAHLLAHLPRFQADYNAAVAGYRRVNRVRSATHPVPDLARDADWHEAPFWIWRRDDPRRRRLFARLAGGNVALTDRAGWELRLPGPPASAAEALLDLPRQGVRLRTRALTTTIWARLFLSDLFVHGIGGARYDQVTDRIIRTFYGVLPPEYLVVTATLRLPIGGTRATDDDVRRLDHQLRELDFHPERFLPAPIPGEPSPPWAAHVAEKQAAIARTPTRETARARCRAIRAANAALQPWVAMQRAETMAHRAAAGESRRAAEAWDGREYAFALFPREKLSDFFTGNWGYQRLD
jgi:hypothetical protein